MTSTVGFDVDLSDATRWSLYSGVYMFGWGVVLVLVLSDVLSLLADVLGLPAQYWVIVFAGPTVLVGAGTWWFLVERPRRYSYWWGGLAGLLTALLTAVFWTASFVSIWGVEMLAVPMVSLLAAVVFGVVSVAGTLLGLALMYPRRRVARTATTGDSD